MSLLIRRLIFLFLLLILQPCQLMLLSWMVHSEVTLTDILNKNRHQLGSQKWNQMVIWTQKSNHLSASRISSSNDLPLSLTLNIVVRTNQGQRNLIFYPVYTINKPKDKMLQIKPSHLPIDTHISINNAFFIQVTGTTMIMTNGWASTP